MVNLPPQQTDSFYAGLLMSSYLIQVGCNRDVSKICMTLALEN